ncbi:hypothetical protein PCANC_09431 [Puccinia coronata f. sp. avenae]|uniref:Myb/SANT-like domain-containing protein n=1 Tax=Puccinia coronata f. sp. avenae TaxID=200324 RepID=A0A2N5SUB3_9BASI|nr:hypothetical protein PCANC_09431 [Puccinia coronata f. sp. avenae]
MDNSDSDSEGAAIVKEILANAAKQKALEKRRAAVCMGHVPPPSRPARSTTQLRNKSRKPSTNVVRIISARTPSAPSGAQTSLIRTTPQVFSTGPTPQVSSTRTNLTSLPSGGQTLIWTAPMVRSMLSFYMAEVGSGRKTHSGFPDSSHQELAEQLRKDFPEARHAHDVNVLKLKLTKSFKNDYEDFLACTQTPGFLWDRTKWEVSALDDVWAQFLEVMLICASFRCIHCRHWRWTLTEFCLCLQSHPHAKKFRGVPFPNFPKLDIILGQWGLNMPLYSKTCTPPPLPFAIPPQNPPNRLAISPTLSVGSSHSKVVSAASGDASLVVLPSSPNQTKRLKSPHEQVHASGTCNMPAHQQVSSAATCNIQRAMELYQDVHAQDATPREALTAFKIFRDNTSAFIFAQIRDKHLRSLWLQVEVDEMTAHNGNLFPSLISQ